MRTSVTPGTARAASSPSTPLAACRARESESSSPPPPRVSRDHRRSTRPTRAAAAPPRATRRRPAPPRSRNAEHARAQPADRPRRDFEHIHAPVARHAALGVDRTVVQAQRLRRPRHRRQRSCCLRTASSARRRDVDRLFEERARRADRACRRSRASVSAPSVITPSIANSRPAM